MVGEGSVRDAQAIAGDTPDLAVGLHVTLLRGTPVLTGPKVRAIVGGTNRFGEDPVAVGLRYFFSPQARNAVGAEVEAQFERFCASGIPLSHVDSHLHFHLHPVIWASILAVAPRYGCTRIRIPLDSYEIYHSVDPTDARRHRFLAKIFKFLCRRLRNQAQAAGLYSTDLVLGLFRTGRLNAPYLERLIELLPDGTHELHCHPDEDTPSGRAELDALLDSRVLSALRRRGIELTTYPAAELT